MSIVYCTQCKVRTAPLICPPTGKSYCSVACQVSEWLKTKRQQRLFIGVKPGAVVAAKKRTREGCDSWENDITIPLSQIICGQFRIGQDWQRVLAGVECTAIGERVARSLIRVAATRIFSDPTQSILEPIVNSLDAYAPQLKTGKFGMGFFSLLYWVMLYNARIAIRSTYAIETSTDNNNILCSYAATIYLEQGQVLMIHLENRELVDGAQTGTEIEVQMPVPLTGELERRFEIQLEKLRFVRAAPILYNGKLLNKPWKLIFTEENKPVTVVLSPELKGFRVSDLATGISRDVLLSSLLVPTISTKTIQMSSMQERTPYRTKFLVFKGTDRLNRFVVLVNFIGVVFLPYQSPEQEVFYWALDLPPWTKIPVSRDDVILSSIMDDFQNIVENCAKGMAQQYRTIVPLQAAFETWSAQTTSEENKTIIQAVLKYLENQFKGFLVGHEDARFYRKLESTQIGIFVSSLRWDPKQVEGTVRLKFGAANINSSFFLGRDVIFLDGDFPPFTAGLPGLLFVSKTYANDPLWPEKAQTSLFSTTLVLRKPPNLKRTEAKARNRVLKASSRSNPRLTDEARDLIVEILDQETTAARNGWEISQTADVSAEVFMRLIDQNLIGIELLQFLAREWYPKIIRGPGNYQYQKEDFPKYTSLPPFENLVPSVLFSFNINVQSSDNLVYIQDDTDANQIKARDFATDAMFFIMRACLKFYDQLLNISLSAIGWGVSYGPLHSIKMIQLKTEDRLFGDFMLDLVNVCNTGPEFYWCQTVLLYLDGLTQSSSKNVSPVLGGGGGGGLSIIALIDKMRKKYGLYIANMLLNLIRVQFANDPKYVSLRTTAKGLFLDYFIEFKNDTNTAIANTFLRLLDRMDRTSRPQKLPLIQDIEGALSFSLNDFIAYSFQHEWPHNPADFVRALEAQIAIGPTVPLATQMIEIVVNEGTTKDVMNTQLTEMVQNSLDAILEFDAKNMSVDITIQTDGLQLFLSVRDYVGIELPGLIAMSIPFYSNKAMMMPGLVGEMGTGFFNLYRSDAVLIETCRDGDCFHIYDVPRRDPITQRVLDVDRRLSYKREKRKGKNMTTITVVSKFPDEQSLLLAENVAKEFVGQVLGLMQVPGSMNLNGLNVRKPLMMFKQNQYFEMYHSANKVEFTSYVLTKGVAFQPFLTFAQSLESTALSDRNRGVVRYLEDVLSHGYVLNIRGSAYTPVQTRASVQMSDAVKDGLRTFLLQCAYEHVLALPAEQRYKYFKFYSEGKRGGGGDELVKASQVLPSRVPWYPYAQPSMMQFITQSALYTGLPAFSDLIHIMYEKYLQGFYRGEYPQNIGWGILAMPFSIKEEFQGRLLAVLMQTPPPPRLEEKLLEIAHDWFKGKRVETPEDRAEIQRQREDPTLPANIVWSRQDKGGLLKFLETWISTYVEIGIELGIFAPNRQVAKIDITPFGNSAFTSATQSIHFRIQPDEFRFHMLFQKAGESESLQQLLERIPELEKVTLWRDFYGPGGTIAHELEHFRRDGDHSNLDPRASHSDALIDLPIGGSKNRTFGQCHVDTMQSVLQQNFYQRLWQKLKNK